MREFRAQFIESRVPSTVVCAYVSISFRLVDSGQGDIPVESAFAPRSGLEKCPSAIVCILRRDQRDVMVVVLCPPGPIYKRRHVQKEEKYACIASSPWA